MKTLSFILSFFFLSLLYAQSNQVSKNAQGQPSSKNQGFQSFPVFSSSSEAVGESIRSIATDASFLNVDESVLAQIQQSKPKFISFQVPFANEVLQVKMQRVNIFSENFIVRNQNDEILNYTPGLYYRGIVNDDRNSLAVFNFFDGSVNGIISETHTGNKIIGQLKDASNYVIYTDSEMTVTQDFVCEVDSFEQDVNLLPQNEVSNSSNLSTNCVRIFYELTNDVYTSNSSTVNDTMNWITSVHNIIASLYSGSNVSTALSDVLIWQQNDPYTGNNGNKLSFFRQNRTAFNGDLASLIDFPATGGVAFLNSLCQDNRHAFSGASAFFQQLPTYSWAVDVITHEMGHSMGSPHTHSCFWNGNNTAIDACGPNNGFSEGCDNGPIPSGGGTVMSYCHLDPVGKNLASGFHPQVGNYIQNNIDTKSCLGTDCINSCMQTVADVTVSQSDINSFTVNIDDVISNSWDYRIFEADAIFPGGFSTSSNSSIVFNNVQPNTYYIIEVSNSCASGSFGSNFQITYLSDDDWCSGVTFTDTGGLNDNYQENENFVKTFYPNFQNELITLNINSINIEQGFDFMNIYDGESTNAPIFTGGANISGSSPNVTVFEATNSAGAITVEFTSDFTVNTSGWDITVSCVTFSNKEFSKSEVYMFPNPFINQLNLESEIELDKVSIFDLNGKIVFEKSLQQQTKSVLSLNQLSAGIYIVKIENENSFITKRIVKK